MAGPVSVNFAHLVVHEPLLDEYGGAAEAYLARDPNTALVKLRQFGEVLTQQVAVETRGTRRVLDPNAAADPRPRRAPVAPTFVFVFVRSYAIRGVASAPVTSISPVVIQG